MAVPIVGEKIMGALMARRSFQAPIQALGILEHLSIGRASGRGFLLRSFAALILHLAAVEAMADARRYRLEVNRSDSAEMSTRGTGLK